MSSTGQSSDTTADDYEMRDVFEQLDELEETVTSPEERREVRRTRRMLERVPGSGRIRTYTTRDVAEGVVGGILFSLPLLVEDGVFQIAEWFLETRVAGLPVFLAANVVAILCLTAGLLYLTDIREVEVQYVFGFLPKRLTASLILSFLVAAVTMFLWGRLHAAGDPTNLDIFARITVVWTAAALGATLGDILPGESDGLEIDRLLDRIGDNE